jgi:hypothetical protein
MRQSILRNRHWLWFERDSSPNASVYFWRSWPTTWADYQGGRFAPALVAVPEVADGEDAGDGSEILGWNVQDGSPRWGLAPQRRSALRLFRCRC